MAVGEGRQSPINAVLAELVWLFNIIHNILGTKELVSVVQDDGEEGTMDVQAAIVVNEAQLFELI